MYLIAFIYRLLGDGAGDAERDGDGLLMLPEPLPGLCMLLPLEGLAAGCDDLDGTDGLTVLEGELEGCTDLDGEDGLTVLEGV